MRHFLFLLFPLFALGQGSVNDYIFYQKPASGPLVVRPVTPTVGRLMGWPTSISAPSAITLGTGLSLSGSTLNAASSSAWADITDKPTTVSGFGITDAFAGGAADAAKAIWYDGTSGIGAGTIIFEGATADAFEVTLTANDPTADTNLFLPNGGTGGTLMVNAGSPQSARAIWGATTGLIFEGTTADDFETTLAPAAPSADHTVTLPNVTGILITTGDTGTISNTMLAGSIALSKLATTGTADNTTYLRGDGAWTAISSGATLAANTFTGLQQFSGTTHAGLRLNNLTTAERDALSSPAAGMAIWNTTDARLQLHNGSSWTSGMVRLSGDTMTGGLTISSTTSLLLGTAGSAVGNIGFRNATSGTATLEPPTGALGTYTVTLPGVASTLATLGANTFTTTQTLSGANSFLDFLGTGSSDTVMLKQRGVTVLRTAYTGTVLYSDFRLELGLGISWGNDVFLVRNGAASLQMGNNTSANGATAIAQTLKGPNATGTTSTGGSLTIAGGTGTSAGGAVILAASATTGAPATAVTVNNNAVTTFAKPPVLPVYTVATLPATAAAGMVQGAMAIVTDAQNSNHHSTVTGGGSTVICVFYDGTNWKSH